MVPSPRQVAETVSQILESVWPQGINDGIPWLDALGIETQTGQQSTRGGSSSRAWQRAPMPAWGTATAGWSTYQDRFADISWFLWDGANSECVLNAAVELAELFVDALGEPGESTEAGPYSGGTWWWQMEAHSIEMYAHTVVQRPDGHPTGPPCVQLSVDLLEISGRRETEARRTHRAPRDPRI